MKKGWLIGGGALLLVALVVAGIVRGGGKKGEKVFVEKAERTSITQSVKASGQIQPRVKVNISAHVIGKIEKLYVQEGEAIREGDPFLELERPAFLAERDNARAQHSKAGSEVRQAEIALADQEVRLERAKRLSGEGIASPESLEAATLAWQSAKLRLEQAKENVKQTKAILDKAEDDLRKTTIYSPLSGRVVALNAEQGEVVVSGTMNNPASVIGTIADLSEILSEIDVDETEIVHLRVGQKATVNVDAMPDRTFPAEVVEIGSSGYSKPSQPDVTFFRVKLLLETPDPALRPGMSSRAEVAVAKHDDVVVVPIQSVVDREAGNTAAGADEPERSVVYVVDGGKSVEKAVTTGLSDATRVEIASGLDGGESVITGPYRTLRRMKAGEKVEIGKPDLEGDAKSTSKKGEGEGN